MNSIVAAVTALWEFIVFPVVLVAAIALVVWGVALPEVGWRSRLIAWLTLKGFKEEPIRARLETYGLAKVVPVVALFTVVFLLYAARSITDAVGDVLPGRVTYNPSALILHVGNPEQLGSLWQQLPSLRDPRQLGTQLAERAAIIRARDSSSLGSGSAQWRKTLARNAERFGAVKAIVLIAIFTYLLRLRVREGRGKRTRNLLLTFLAGICAGAFFIVQQVYAIEQIGFADFQSVWVFSSEADRVLPKPALEQLDTLEDYKEQAAMEWWTFRWADWAYPKWLSRTFLQRQLFRQAIPVRGKVTKGTMFSMNPDG